MKQRKRNYKLLILFVFIFSLLPKICFSLGFGEIKLYSYLNESLDAEIALQGAEDIDTSHLLVSLASIEDFKRIELARPYFLSKLRFEVVQKNKETFLKVTSEDPVKEPYLSFLVVMTWPEGRVVRDYTLLLDPAPFGGISKRAASEQALQMLKANIESPNENTLPPIQEPHIPVLETKLAAVELNNQKTVPIAVELPPLKSVHSSVTTASTLQNKLLLFSVFILLLAIGLIVWSLKRTRSSRPLSTENTIDIFQDRLAVNAEIKIKLELADQYLAIQDIQNADAILQEVISRGNKREIKLAEELLKKIK
jgi:FimV-like protein